AYFGSFLLGLALFLQVGLGFSVLHAGLTFAPVGVAFAFTSLLVRPLLDRYGRRVIVIGLASSLAGVVALLLDIHVSGDASSALRLLLPLLLIGSGNGCVLPAIVGVALVDVPPHKAGSGAGALTTSQQFAGAVGVAVLGELFFAVLGEQPSLDRYFTAMQAVLVLDLVLLVLSLALTAVLPRTAGLHVAAEQPAGQRITTGNGQLGSAELARGRVRDVLARVRVDSIERALPVYRRLSGADAVRRFSFRDVEVAWVGPFLLLSGPRGSIEQHADRVATLLVDDV